MKKKVLKLSLITFITGVLCLVIAFLAFHFLTKQGISAVWQTTAQKPYITELIGDFAIINIAVSFVSLLISQIFFRENNTK